jgi:hypothetical protein
LTVGKIGNAVRNLPGKGHGMGDQDHGNACLRQGADDVFDLGHQLRIEGRSDLI